MFNFYFLPDLALKNASEVQKTIINFAGSQLIWIIILLFIVFIIWKLLSQTFNVAKLALFALPIIYLLNLALRYIVTSSSSLTRNFSTVLPKENQLPAEQTLIAVSVALIIMSESKIFGFILLVISGIIGYSRVLGGAARLEDLIYSFVIGLTGIIIAKIVMNKISK